jgi:hypothetical protein
VADEPALSGCDLSGDRVTAVSPAASLLLLAVVISVIPNISYYEGSCKHFSIRVLRWYLFRHEFKVARELGDTE